MDKICVAFKTEIEVNSVVYVFAVDLPYVFSHTHQNV